MSEFGKGLTYPLGLFLSHAERGMYSKEGEEGYLICQAEYWFYAAADHLFELQAPSFLPKKIQRRIRKFKDRCLGLRLPISPNKKATKEDKEWAIQEAKDLLLEIDKAIGVRVKKAQFE